MARLRSAPGLIRSSSLVATKPFAWHLPTHLYYIAIRPPGGQPVYKVGITKDNIGTRFKAERGRVHIDILGEWTFDDRGSAKQAERQILLVFSHYKLNPRLKIVPKVSILARGNGELFRQDIWKGYALVGGEPHPGEVIFRSLVAQGGGRPRAP